MVGRKQYFTSREETFPLVGGNASVPEVMRAGGSDWAFPADGGEPTGGTGNETDAASAMNMTTAIRRSLIHVSLPRGQSTLQPLRKEVLRAPRVLGAAEALGLAPSKHVSCLAVGNPSGPGGSSNYSADATNMADDDLSGYTDIVRFRLLDVHEALLALVKREQDAERGWNHHKTTGRQGTLASVLMTAHSKVLSGHYSLNALFMRQSWLLRDISDFTIRNLISCLRPQVYLPGEIVACPHSYRMRGVRQLCFLRRGRILIVGASSLTNGVAQAAAGGILPKDNEMICVCQESSRHPNKEGRVLEILEPGTIFGELSLLFGEPHTHMLVADKACDIWCLPHKDFSSITRRDDALQQSLLAKASARRRQWLDEQRLTPAIANHLREHSPLFRALNDVALRLVQERLEPVFFSLGSLVTSTSERCEEMLFVTRGQLISISGGTIAYGPGDVIGESCLIPHRWPFALSAKTILECWRLRREDLIDALERIEILHILSGRADGQVFAYMKHLFRSPVPEVDTNLLGQQCMPIVEPPPGGFGYVAFAKRLAEIHLKALCFLHASRIKLEDIKYATISSEKTGIADKDFGDDGIVHKYILSKMKHAHAKTFGGDPVSVCSVPEALTASYDQSQVNSAMFTKSISGSLKRRVPPLSVVIDKCVHEQMERLNRSTSVPTKHKKHGKNASLDVSIANTKILSGLPPSHRKKSQYRANTGFGAFLLKMDTASAPSRGPHPPRRPPSSTSRQDGSSKPKRLQSPSSAEGNLINPRLNRYNKTRVCDQGSGKGTSLPPFLQKYLNMMNERDKAMEAEKNKSGREHSHPRSQSSKGKTFVSTMIESPPTRNPFTQINVAGSSPVVETKIRADQANALQIYLDRLPPVHLFLMAEKPQAVITMEEALSIGYVLQLPSIDDIQSCVSLVDPDVSICPLAHRARLRTMAITPNDRFHKHNFYFAAVCFDEDVNKPSANQLEKQAIDLERDKALKLLTIIRADALSHWSTVAQRKRLSNEENISQEDEEDLIAGPSNSQHLSESRGASLSPFHREMITPSVSDRGEKKRESFLRLLKESPNKMINLLHKKYNLTLPETLSIKRESITALVHSKAERRPAMMDHRAPVLERLLKAVTAEGTSSDLHQPTSTPELKSDASLSALESAAVSVPNIATSNLRSSSIVEHDLQDSQSFPLGSQPRSYSATNQTCNSLRGSYSSFACHFSSPNIAQLKKNVLEDHFQKHETSLVVDRYGSLNHPNMVSFEIDKNLPMRIKGNSLSSTSKEPFYRHSSLDLTQSSLLTHPSVAFAGTRPAMPNAEEEEMASPLRSADELNPRDFVMPDVENADAIVSSMQQDIEVLKAVAKQQADERERTQNESDTFPTARYAAGSLCQDFSDEAGHVLENMRRICYSSEVETARPIAVPNFLVSEAGPDYLAEAYTEVNSMDTGKTTPYRLSKGVHLWQRELKSSKPVIAEADTSCAQENDAVRSVVASIGSTQFGHNAVPLACPMQNFTPEEYAKWVKNREDTLSSYLI
ncbi:unnamed protein product, partial [Phytomonas sp. Hart1]